MIQDLNDLSYLGRTNRPLLEAIRFDMSLLEKAAQTSTDMGYISMHLRHAKSRQARNSKKKQQEG